MKKAYFEKRLTILKTPMIYRKRVKKSRGFCIETGSVFRSFHFGKRTLVVQLKNPKDVNRKIWDCITWSK